MTAPREAPGRAGVPGQARAAMLAVVPVRDGVLPAGADEVVAECGGRAVFIGEGAGKAAASLETAAVALAAVEAGAYAPAAWAAALAELVAEARVIVLPGSPDGRDLAPRLADRLDRPLWTNAVAVQADRVRVARFDGRVLVESALPAGAVATLVPGVAGVVPRPHGASLPPVSVLDVAVPDLHDAEVLEVLPPDAATMDLAEAPRVFAGGAGLGQAAEFDLLRAVAARLDASMGATRVIADQGWVEFARQIGTTGTMINPRLYVAFGISGAVQHITGIGDPDHVIAVNTDPSCPMMTRADLAVVADAPAVLAELARRLDVPLPAALAGRGQPAASAQEDSRV